MSKKILMFATDLGMTMSSYLRMIQPGRHLKADLASKGIELEYSASLHGYYEGKSKYAAIVNLRTIRNSLALRFLAYERSRGCKTIFAIDDDFTSIPFWSPCYREDQVVDTNYALTHHDLCWTSTEALSRKIEITNRVPCRTLPNLVDMSDWLPPLPKQEGPVRIVWAGSNTHKNDLELIVTACQRILDEFGPDRVAFHFFGEAPMGLIASHWNKGVTYDPIPIPTVEYPRRLHEFRADLMLCPIQDIPFNHSKSCLKVLEAVLAGAVPIVSPVGPYLEFKEKAIFAEGNTDQGWYEALKRGINTRHGDRCYIWDRLRNYVVQNHTWSAETPRRKWFEAFLEAADS